MTNNRSAGQSPDELLDRAVAALVREWGVSETEARAALERARYDEARLRRNGRVISLDEIPEQRTEERDRA